MGMYDTVYVEVGLPEGVQQFGPGQDIAGGSLQTKTFDCVMDHYIITADGRLQREIAEMVEVPPEQRPYYGTPRWDEPGGFWQMAGSLRRVVKGREDIAYHGDIHMVGDPSVSVAGACVTVVARFTEGRLTWIRKQDGEDES